MTLEHLRGLEALVATHRARVFAFSLVKGAALAIAGEGVAIAQFAVRADGFLRLAQNDLAVAERRLADARDAYVTVERETVRRRTHEASQPLSDEEREVLAKLRERYVGTSWNGQTITSPLAHEDLAIFIAAMRAGEKDRLGKFVSTTPRGAMAHEIRRLVIVPLMVQSKPMVADPPMVQIVPMSDEARRNAI